MMAVLVVLALLASLPIVVIDGVFVAEVLLGLKRGRARLLPTAIPRVALLVPAHNEEAGVRAAVAAMRAAAPPGTRVLVVAHNCTDATAAEAEAGGAEVHRLDEPDRRGKGYALAGGRDRLAIDPPQVVVAIDADCIPEPDAVARLAATALASGRAVQAAYLFRPRLDAPAVVQISNFAMLVKNLVRQRGGRRIGGPALLTGSGMAFPWPLFATLDLATGNLVEDLALGVDLVRAGRPPLFEEHALIWSDPSNARGTGTQRARWEGGFLATARSLGLPLLGRGLARGRWRMIWMGLHLLTVPLTLLLVLNGALALGWALLWLLGAPPGPAIAAWALLALVVGSVLAAWAAAGRTVLPARVLARLPVYLFWKLAIYFRLARGRDRAAWTRTERVE